MNSFPEQLRPENIGEFGAYRRRRLLAYLRRHIFEAMLKPLFGVNDSEADNPKSYGIDLTTIDVGSFEPFGYKIDPELLTTVCDELQILGWKSQVSHGGTMLFVYPENEDPPSEIISATTFE